MARKEEESAISLFSFQDIITSLTGIMFLIVLLLVLLLLSSHVIKEPQPLDPEATALQEKLEQLKTELQQLEQSHQENAQRLEELRALSPEELKKRIIEMHERIAELQKHLQDSQIQLQIAQEQLEVLLQEIVANNELKNAMLKELEELQSKIRDIQTAITRQQQENEENKDLMQFSIERQSGKSPLLIELDKNGIIMLVVDTNERFDYRTPGAPRGSINKFLSALSNYHYSRYYVCILVKPSGFPYASDLVYTLKSKNFERGVEIMPDDASTVFGGSQK